MRLFRGLLLKAGATKGKVTCYPDENWPSMTIEA